MSEPFDASSVCLNCNPPGRLDMHGMKGLLSLFDIKTDRVYNTVSTGKCIGDRPLIADIGFDRLKLRIIRTKQLLGPFRMS